MSSCDPYAPGIGAQTVRCKSEALGSVQVSESSHFGVHVIRALGSSGRCGRSVHWHLVHACATVELACAVTHRALGFLPDATAADAKVSPVDLLTRSARSLGERCVEGIVANEERCRAHVGNATAAATALLAVMSYTEASRLERIAIGSGRARRDVVLEEGRLSAEQYDRLVRAEAICALGAPPQRARKP